MIRLVVEVEAAGLSPRELREAFVQSLREVILAEHAAGRLDVAVIEELLRALPERGRA